MHSFAMTTAPQASAPATKGMVVHWAARYDLLIWALTLGRERRLRERLLEPVNLRAGESVLDVGCGTGTLAMIARDRVGPAGSVHGIDPSPEMIVRARHKAAKSVVDVTFDTAVAESLPFSDGRFDVVLCTVMLHHLPRAIRAQSIREMGRVLKPGGRLLAVDFGERGHGGGLIARIHRRAQLRGRELEELVGVGGLRVIDSGAVGMWNLQFAVAESPASGSAVGR